MTHFLFLKNGLSIPTASRSSYAARAGLANQHLCVSSPPRTVLRLDACAPSSQTVSFREGDRDYSYRLVSIPFYAVHLLPRFLERERA